MGLKNLETGGTGGVFPGGLSRLGSIVDIPDSAQYYWDPSTYANGDPNWTDELQGVDVAINGDPQTTTLSDGSIAIQGDGTDDYGVWSSGDINWGDEIDTGASWEIVVETTTSDTVICAIGGRSSGTQSLQVRLNSDGDYNGVDGEITAQVKRGSSSLTVDTGGSVNVNDGNRHNVSVVVNDPSTNDIEIIVDGTTYTNKVRSQGPSGFNDHPSDIYFWAFADDGSPVAYAQTALGSIMFHTTNLSEQKIDQF